MAAVDQEAHDDVHLGGWEFEFLDEVERDYECSVCMMPMRDPYMTKCGHNMCKSCMDQILATTSICPEDRKPITENDVFPNEMWNRRIMALKVECPFSETNCTWTGELVDLVRTHMVACGVEPIPCNECNGQPTRREFRKHVNDLCIWRLIRCKFCFKEIAACMMQVHLDKYCQKVLIPCPNLCGVIFLREELLKHTTEVCMDRIVECPFNEFGCRNEVIMRLLEKHINDDVGSHLLLMKEQFKNLEKEQAKEIESNKREHAKYTEKIEMLTEELKNMKFYQEELPYFLICLEDKSVLSNLKYLKDDKVMFKNYIAFLREEHYFGRQESPIYLPGSWVYEDDKDVVLIWLISNFSEKRKSEDKLLSPIFSVGERGYNVQAMLYPKGNGSSVGYISLFIRIQPGTFDSLLQWPFTQPFTLRILNLRNIQDSRIVSKSKYDLMRKNREALRRCIDKPDDVLGFGNAKHTKLVDIETMPGFLINDTITVKVTVLKEKPTTNVSQTDRKQSIFLT